jgi:hypothetical protein
VGAEIVTAVVAVVVLIGTVAVRSLTRNRVEIKLNDAIIAAIAAALTLLVSGRITKLAVGTEGVTVETARDAILSASAQPIAAQIAPVPVVPVEMALKGGVGDIPEMVRKQVEALELLLGANAYDPHAVQQYLETLTKHPFFHYVVVLNQNETLFGMIDARKLLALLQDPGSGQTYASFAMLINRGGNDERGQLAKLPGFVPLGDAVARQSDKREVLEKMEKLGRDWLPVVSPDGHLQGIIDRSRLTASMILDVTNQLKALPAAKP